VGKFKTNRRTGELFSFKIVNILRIYMYTNFSNKDAKIILNLSKLIRYRFDFEREEVTRSPISFKFIH
jgi:hypothetical protein